MRCIRRAVRGVTVVETVIGATLAMIVMGGLLSILVQALAMVQSSVERAEPRAAAQLTLVQVRHALADAAAYQISATGELTFATSYGDGRVHRDGGALVLQLPGRPPSRIISHGVAAFVVRSTEPGLIRIAVEIDRGHGRSPVNAVTSIYLASVALTVGDTPWRFPRALAR